MNALLLTSCLLPLLLAALWLSSRARRYLPALLPWAPLPALLVALLLPADTSAALPWLLMGSGLQLDDVSRVFLITAALLWLAAGHYARAYLRKDSNAPRFALLWMLTLGGNLGLIIAADVALFYTLFALMTFAAYGLVIHSGRAEALRAGRVYIAMAVMGEGLIIAGLLMAVNATGEVQLVLLSQRLAEQSDTLIPALLLMGFGVKAGLPLLHMWLPLAHPVAPTPASAVLSAAMIKAGLLAWLKLLPLGAVALPLWGEVMVAAGLLAAFGGALIGISQRDAKAVLAYSSISQMGIITTLVGAGMLAPELWPLLLPAICLYVMHHGFAKAALFLTVGVAEHWRAARYWLWLAVSLPALALAGLPLTSGAAAKLQMKDALYAAADNGLSALPLWLSVAAVGTTLLMARYLFCLRSKVGSSDPMPGLLPGWILSLLLTLTGVWLLPQAGGAALKNGLGDSVDLLWPIAGGITLAMLAARYLRRYPDIPAGDLVVLLERALQAMMQPGTRAIALLSSTVARSRSVSSEGLYRFRHLADHISAGDAALRVGFAMGFGLLLVVIMGLMML